jgi:hypothetical protein
MRKLLAPVAACLLIGLVGCKPSSHEVAAAYAKRADEICGCSSNFSKLGRPPTKREVLHQDDYAMGCVRRLERYLPPLPSADAQLDPADRSTLELSLMRANECKERFRSAASTIDPAKDAELKRRVMEAFDAANAAQNKPQPAP